MQWSSLAGTALGALIGVSATLFADRLRWRLGRQDMDKATKRQTYADYLAALSNTRNELRGAARDESVVLADRARRAVEAFKAGEAYELRYQVELIAPGAVIDASDKAFRALRKLRDLVEAGALHTEKLYISQRDLWETEFAELRRQMKDDLAGS